MDFADVNAEEATLRDPGYNFSEERRPLVVRYQRSFGDQGLTMREASGRADHGINLCSLYIQLDEIRKRECIFTD